MNDDTPNKKFHAPQKYESQLATVIFMISNENVHNSHCLNMVEMALRCHHLAYRFLKNSGGEPPYPPSNHSPLPKAAYGPVNKRYDGLREYHTPGGGVSALLKPTTPERYHQSYYVYVLDEK